MTILKYLAYLFSIIFLISCKSDDEKNEKPIVIPEFLSVKRMDCESNIEKCGSIPGIKFTGLAPRIMMKRPNWNLDLRAEYTPDAYSLIICCDSIPQLIDSLKKMNEVLEEWRQNKPDHERRTCNLSDSISITIIYAKDLSGTGEYSSIEFGREPDRTVFFITTKKQFEDFFENLKNLFRTCCLS